MHTQKGFSHVLVLVLLVVAVAIAGAGVAVYRANNKPEDKNASESQIQTETKSSALIKNIGINLDTYNPATGMTGDIRFPKEKFSSDLDLIFHEYGMQIEANSASQARKNPQPTFIVPLGTKVMSLVDGEVINVPKLYSNDYSIHVQPKGSDLVFETEHVINVKVKVGDKVTAGQEIAEVSDYDAENYAGLGLYEIGILKPGNPPSHVCPFDYLDESIREDTFAKLTALMKSWEEFRGNQSLYDEVSVVVPGCVTRDEVEG